MRAVTRTETKDGSSYDFTQYSHRSEKPTCLFCSTCPCRCVTATWSATIIQWHALLSCPLSSHHLLTLQAYNEMRRSAITMPSHSLRRLDHPSHLVIAQHMRGLLGS